MSRPVAGLACRIRVPVRQYQAVALLVRGNSNVIRLMHRDVGLSLDVEAFDSFADGGGISRPARRLPRSSAVIVIAASPKAGRADATDAARERRVRLGAHAAAALPDAPACGRSDRHPQDRRARDHRAQLSASNRERP